MSLKIKVSSLREALERAVQNVRQRLSDPLARVAFVVPSKVNAEQVRRQLGEAGPFIHVDFITPGTLVSSLGQLALLQQGLKPEPSGWLGAWLHRHIPRLHAEGLLHERYGETLTQPGWLGPVQRALGELQAGRVSAAQLQEAAGDDPIGERLRLIAQIMAEVEQARREQSYYTQTDLEDSALARIKEGAALPCQSIEGAVVLGDGLLPPGTFEVLSAWLSRRDVVRVALPPFNRLPSAPWGLRQAAADARCIVVKPDFSRLGHLKGMLFSSRLVMAASDPDEDDSVQCVSTPDEVREMDEVARTVQSAIQAGIALDRIAVVLPDNDGADILASALRRASIPATWLTAAPLIGEPCARFLTLALAIARNPDDVSHWYDMLTQPGVMGLPRTGRGRWRTLLSGCPKGQGAHGLLDHLQGEARRAEEEENERQHRAAQALVQSIGQILNDLEAFPEEGTLGAHAAAWGEFIERWWRPSPERARILQAVSAWGGGGEDVTLPMEGAVQLLGDELRSVQLLRGSLTQARIRVLPPMGLLGGSFELICATGLSEGRFPRQPRENPLLTDAMVERLRERGARLVTSEEIHDVERRRFGAVVAACQGTLWLSTPRFEMIEGRPMLPGGLLMDALSCLEGRRVRYSDLPQLMHRQGSRARPLASHVEDALGAGEHLLARAVYEPERALGVLASQPATRNLLTLHRAIDRLRLGIDPVPNGWTGFVSSELLSPGFLSGDALSPRDLAKLVHDPAGYFWRHILGAWRARNLRRPSFDMTLRGIEKQAFQLALEALDDPEGRPDRRFEALWEDRIQDAARLLGVQDDTQLNTWRQLGQMARDRLFEEHQIDLQGAPAHAEDVTLIEHTPLRVSGEVGRVRGDTLVVPVRSDMGPLKPDRERAFVALTQGFAARGGGQPIAQVKVVDMNGKRREQDLASTESAYQRIVEQACARAQIGWWPVANQDDPFALEAERRAGATLTPEAMASIIDRLSNAP